MVGTSGRVSLGQSNSTLNNLLLYSVLPTLSTFVHHLMKVHQHHFYIFSTNNILIGSFYLFCYMKYFISMRCDMGKDIFFSFSFCKPNHMFHNKFSIIVFFLCRNSLIILALFLYHFLFFLMALLTRSFHHQVSGHH